MEKKKYEKKSYVSLNGDSRNLFRQSNNHYLHQIDKHPERGSELPKIVEQKARLVFCADSPKNLSPPRQTEKCTTLISKCDIVSNNSEESTYSSLKLRRPKRKL